jgi:hypothetical protein
MAIQCTLDDQVVKIVDIDLNGSDIYISYIDPSDNLLVKKKWFKQHDAESGLTYMLIATSATLV